MTTTDFSKLKKNLKKDYSGFNKVKVALLGDSATQFLNQALQATGYDYHLNLEIWEADFDQVERQIFDHASSFYEFAPDIVLIFKSSVKLLLKFNKLPVEDLQTLAASELSLLKQLVDSVERKLQAQIIYYNYNEVDDAVFGSFCNKTPSSFLYQLRQLNYELMVYAASKSNFFIADLSSLQNKLGKTAFFNPAIYVTTDMVLQPEVLPYVGSITLDIISAMLGQVKKCVILDLDNTLWGGVIGDDGLESIQLGSLGIGKAFTEFQYWLKKLKNRGLLLAVCSKNTESVAQEPFLSHPDMPLKLEDIAVFVANWENKVDNINHIQRVLNIGFDSMVFLDDNPFERNIVRENIPLLTVPELPEDPALYLEFLYAANLFETVTHSEEDQDRTRKYQKEAERFKIQQNFTNEVEFLESLNMQSHVEPFNNFNRPRVAQLSQRSNQFNLRTIRYSESDVENLMASKEHFSFAFNLKDKFGDNGLISLVVLKIEPDQTLFIETWLMSCRVLKRGMEAFVLNTIAKFAFDKGFKSLRGEYIETVKNAMVKNHYQEMGFAEVGGNWLLNLSSYVLKHGPIKICS